MVFLLLDVSPDSLFRNVSDRFNIIRPSPEGWKSRLQERKLLSEFMRGESLQLLNDPVWCGSWCWFHEQMDVVWHHFQFGDLNPNLFCLLVEKLLQSLLHVADQNWSPIFRTPNQVISEIVDRRVTMNPSLTQTLFYWQVSNRPIEALCRRIHPRTERPWLSAGLLVREAMGQNKHFLSPDYSERHPSVAL